VAVKNPESSQRVVAGLRAYIKCWLLNAQLRHWTNNSSPTLLQFSEVAVRPTKLSMAIFNRGSSTESWLNLDFDSATLQEKLRGLVTVM